MRQRLSRWPSAVRCSPRPLRTWSTFSNQDSLTQSIRRYRVIEPPDRPVFLIHLAPASSRSLSSVDSHLCVNDTYFGQITLHPTHLRFQWRVIGPKKTRSSTAPILKLTC